MSGQTKLDEFFAKKSFSTTIKSTKTKIKDEDDEFEKIFQTNSKRQRVEPVVPLPLPSSSSQKKRSNEIEEIFNTKKLRRSIKTEEIDLLDIFNLKEEKPSIDYVRLQPVIVTGGQWLSKSKPIATKEISSIPEEQRNLMNVQFVSLRSSSNGKSFHKVKKDKTKQLNNDFLFAFSKTFSTIRRKFEKKIFEVVTIRC